MNLRAPLGYVLVLAAAVAVYLRALCVGFLSDEFYLPLLVGPDGPDFRQVLRDLTGPWLSVEGSPNYRPGLTLHYAIDAALFGWNPAGFHLSNVLLHALNAGLVFALASMLWREAAPWCWCLCGLVFALHPAAAEAVCWISGRVDTTTAFPYLVSLVLLARWSLGGSGVLLVGSLAAAAASMICKESGITVPLSLALVDGLVRRAMPRVLPVIAAACLAAGYLWARAHALGDALSGAEDSLSPQAIARAIPEKLAALASPAVAKDSRPFFELLHPLLFGVLPGVMALRNATARRFLLWAVLWACALVLPSFQVRLAEGYGGTRVVYLAIVPYALLVGRSLGAKRRSLVGVVAAAGLLSLATLLTDGRNRVHEAASRVVRGHQAWVLAQAPSVRDRGLFLADVMREVAGVTALRYDNAYLAFRRPFLPVDVPVYVGSNMAIDWVDDTAAVQAALRAGMAAFTFDREQGERFESLSPSRRENLALPLEPGVSRGATMSERGLELAAGKEKPELAWEPRAIEATGFEGASVILVGPDVEAPVLSWRPRLPEGTQLPPAVESALAELCRATFFEYREVGDSKRLVAAVGNRAGWTFQYRFRSPVVLRLAVPTGGRPIAVAEAKLLERLPVLDIPQGAATVNPAEAFSIPLAPGTAGHFRLILLTPMQVMEEFATDPSGAIAVGEANRRLLRLVARLAPGTRIHYVIDRLARQKDRASTVERSEARSFVVVRAP